MTERTMAEIYPNSVYQDIPTAPPPEDYARVTRVALGAQIPAECPKCGGPAGHEVWETCGAAPRIFPTGASRDTDDGKLDFEGFLSPLVLERFAQYMHKNRQMTDGSLRASDNWQKGMPVEQYMKSLLRHVMAVWLKYRRDGVIDEEDLCGVLFNTQGLLFESLAVGDVE